MTTFLYVNRHTGDRVSRSVRRKPGVGYHLERVIPDAVEAPPVQCAACGVVIEAEPHAADCPVERAESHVDEPSSEETPTQELPPPPPPAHAERADGAPPSVPSKAPVKQAPRKQAPSSKGSKR